MHDFLYTYTLFNFPTDSFLITNMIYKNIRQCEYSISHNLFVKLDVICKLLFPW